MVESYTDADLPQVVLDLQNEWAMVAGAENYPGLQDRAGVWEEHVKATRPNGSAIKEWPSRRKELTLNHAAPRAVSHADPRLMMGRNEWRHVLDGELGAPKKGGHRRGTGRLYKTEFPPDWTDGRIKSAILDTMEAPEFSKIQGDRTVLRRVVDDVLIEVSYFGNPPRFRTAYPINGTGVVENLPSGYIQKPLDLSKLDE